VIDESGFVSYRGSRILHVFKRFVLWIRFVDWFSKDSTCFYESYESLQILSTIARNESLKIKIRESESLRILKIRIWESGFVTPNPKDSYRGFVSWIRFWKIRFVDSFRENQNLKLLDSFRGFVSWKPKSQITRFVSIRKDSYTNPASLINILNKPNQQRYFTGLTGDGVSEGIEWLVQCLERNTDVRPPKGGREDD
jgi:hypothetical protein